MRLWRKALLLILNALILIVLYILISFNTPPLFDILLVFLFVVAIVLGGILIIDK